VVFGNTSTGMERDPLIRISVMCNLLIESLEDLGDESLSSPQLMEQLRLVGARASEELAQLSGRE
jgi:hypothetical protein